VGRGVIELRSKRDALLREKHETAHAPSRGRR
jgi:hypothetical protein